MNTFETIDGTELNESELDNVTGAGLLHFLRAIAVPGTSESGAESDPNIATHTQLWVTTAS